MVISDGIPAVPRNRKSRNSVPNPSGEEKITRNSVPWNKKEAKSHNSVPNPSAKENTSQNSVPWNQNTVDAHSRNSVPNHSAEVGIPFRASKNITFTLHLNKFMILILKNNYEVKPLPTNKNNKILDKSDLFS